MGIFDRFSTRSIENPNVSLSDPRAFEMIFGESGSSAAGVNVTAESVLKIPAVWAAVNFLSGTVAALPLQLFKRSGDDREADKANPLYRILHDAVNEETTSFRWRKYLMTRTLLTGRSYTLIVRTAGGKVTALLPIDPARVTVVRIDGRTFYDIANAGGKPTRYKARDVIDVMFLSEADLLSHVNPTTRLRDTFGLTTALDNYAARFFQNGGIPPVVMEGPVNSPAAAKRASTDIAQAIANAAQKMRSVLVMPIGHTLKTVGVDPEKSQFKDARRFQIEEVARVYGLPPVFLQDLTHGTYSNTEQQDLHFVKHTLTQWVTQIEQEINLKLFGMSSNESFVEFNVDGMLRGDFSTRMAGLSSAVQNAIITPNEARKLENREPKDNGDDLYIQGATVPLGSNAGEPPAQEPEPIDKPADDAGDEGADT